MKQVKSRRTLRVVDVAVALVTVAGVGFGISRLTTDETAQLCKNAGIRHQLSIKGGVFEDPDISVRRCDMLTIINQDKDSYMLAFGSQDRHQDYPGFDSQLVASGEAITIDAIKEGSYTIHDHKLDKARLQLTVEPFKN